MIKKVLISAKVVPDMVEDINSTGFRTSDIIKAGIMMFLSLPKEAQAEQISKVIKHSNALRAGERFEWLKKIREKESLMSQQPNTI